MAPAPQFPVDCVPTTSLLVIVLKQVLPRVTWNPWLKLSSCLSLLSSCHFVFKVVLQRSACLCHLSLWIKGALPRLTVAALFPIIFFKDLIN